MKDLTIGLVISVTLVTVTLAISWFSYNAGWRAGECYVLHGTLSDKGCVKEFIDAGTGAK